MNGFFDLLITWSELLLSCVEQGRGASRERSDFFAARNPACVNSSHTRWFVIHSHRKEPACIAIRIGQEQIILFNLDFRTPVCYDVATDTRRKEEL